ncbi:MAG: RNA pseudouridine synthase [Rhodospirillaceae bacterium]|nr:RNA pseudouridine synthase [Rhodospirillaceae bacterium]|tara:strand:+ start:265 stop:1236 length:972 start_codon:yes stop_codon:yes gene_type:complete
MKAKKHQFSVKTNSARSRLDQFLTTQLPELSRTRVKTLIIEGQVTVNMKPHGDPASRVVAGDRVIITVPPPQSSKPNPQRIPIDIAYEDKDLIVLNKPAGLVVHPAPGHPDNTLVNALLSHCGPTLSGIGGVRRPGIVHRLDKDTSGLLVVAKNDQTHRQLTNSFITKAIKRKYKAIVLGVPEPRQSDVKASIGRNPKNRKKMAVVSKGGKAAQTFYQVEKIFGDKDASLIVCELTTGRTHQIRVHMAEIGHPVLADRLYGGHRGLRQNSGSLTKIILRDFPRQALHAFTLSFSHPTTNEFMEFRSNLPEDMANLVTLLESGQ